MLESLTVENYALIERLEMTLDSELNIITGETGAGKSILLGALGLLLGEKNDGTATKDNTKSCVIEATFSIASLDLKALFAECDWEWDESVTIRRVITPAGKSRSFVGDIPVSLSDLKKLSTRLIDIHSQHQNQILADSAFRIGAIDLLYESREILAQMASGYGELSSLRTQLRSIEEVAASARRDEEWLSHQVEELTAANLRIGEETEAEAELKILENAGAIGEALATFCSRMDSDDERGVLLAIRNSERDMRAIAHHYPAAEEYAERLASTLAELKDLNSSIEDDCNSVEADPERVAKLTERLDTLYSLCQKHRAHDLEELIALRDRYSEQLLTILNSDDRINELKSEIAKCETEAWKIAKTLTKRRKEAAPLFSSHIECRLHTLGMESASFVVEVTPTSQLSAAGCDDVSFLFSSVAGKNAQSVDKIASGGEISRVMLSIKALLAERMALPTIIFDEIDTGVSGRIADAMGEIIVELATNLQVIDITHLPQVASKGASHFVVYKEAGRTNISRLSSEERVDHIANMLSGSSVTNAAREQAKILLGLS